MSAILNKNAKINSSNLRTISFRALLLLFSQIGAKFTVCDIGLIINGRENKKTYSEKINNSKLKQQKKTIVFSNNKY